MKNTSLIIFFVLLLQLSGCEAVSVSVGPDTVYRRSSFLTDRIVNDLTVDLSDGSAIKLGGAGSEVDRKTIRTILKLVLEAIP